MAQPGKGYGSYDDFLVRCDITIGGLKFNDITVKEVILGESLLTPGLQTAVGLQSFVYSNPIKNWREYKNKTITLDMYDKTGRQMMVEQKVYRIDERQLDINVASTESLMLHACDQSLLNDAKSLVSKSWKCTSPSDIVDYVLNSCAGANETDIQQSDPSRDYIAENIHPFQVIQQQCNVALDGEDPSFLHYMTFENFGTHHFKSLKSLMKGSSQWNFKHSEGNTDLTDPERILFFGFPCDFDYLTDLLNGIDEDGKNMNTLSTFNPVNMAMQLLGAGGEGSGGAGSGGCGVGAANHKQAISNKGTAQQQNGCETDVEKYLLLRQARMALLDKDKVALRLTIPWNPDLHVGQAINFTWPNKSQNGSGSLFGTGTYLISSLKHNIQFGGFGTTTLDCITRNL